MNYTRSRVVSHAGYRGVGRVIMVQTYVITLRLLVFWLALLGMVLHVQDRWAHAETPDANPAETRSQTPNITHGDSNLRFVHSGSLPSLDEIPAGPKGEAIRYGFKLVTQTPKLLKAYLGNTLTCQNCHLGAGRTPHAAPFVGVYSLYPIYRTKNDRVNTLEMRINACFRRSMNGKPLEHDSNEMAALVSYMAWLSEGIPAGTEIPERGFPRIHPTRQPDSKQGNRLFTAKCAVCHGVDGQGTAVAPPLWGPQSFNNGAGMARVPTLAAFIRQNMPRDQGGTLTEDEAFDVAVFVTSQPRPDFPDRIHDYPKGHNPDNAPLF